MMARNVPVSGTGAKLKEGDFMKVVYVSHPFTGNEETNRAASMRITRELAERHPEIVFINPLAVFAAAGAAGLSYEQIMAQCLALLERCDEMILCEGWKWSKGCKMEYHHAIEREIPIKKIMEAGGDD